MPRNRLWPAEWQEYADPVSGVRVRQLTNHKCHSHHIYFTNPGWWDGGRRLLLGSDRENRTNLFSIDLTTGELTQLTDLPPVADRQLETSLLHTTVNPTRDEAVFWYGREMVALDLRTLELRTLWEVPKGFRRSMLNFTADGRYVCAGMAEDLSSRFPVDLLRGYVGFKDTFEGKPLSRIVKVRADGGGAEVIHEEQVWIAHVNTSPTQPNLLTFCHEGPWAQVDHRIWGLDINTSKAWRIRAREVDGERIGHEYWHADGIRVGYHGSRPDGSMLFGHCRYDDSDRVEGRFPGAGTIHVHSNDRRLVVGDGNGVVQLWRWNGQAYEGPRTLCQHRCSMHIQQLHVHPRFSPDGRQVLFTSDMRWYGNVYLVDVAEFDTLPQATTA